MATVDDDNVDMIDQEDADQEQRFINEEYKSWKKNSPFLYDMILSSALEWPTLTTQWFPDVKDDPNKNFRTHRLLLGTHTGPGLNNYLQIAEVDIPKAVEPNPADYDEERGEIGGYGGKASSEEAPAIRFRIVQKMDHPDEVNKARYQPQNPDVIATYAVDGRILVFDRTKHSLQPTGEVNAQVELVGHKKEGFGLSWNPHEAGTLASGGEDEIVCLWDLKTMTQGSKIVKPTRKYSHHTQVVNDVQYHQIAKSLIGTVSDDLTVQILDVRQESNDKAALVGRGGHADAINAISFNPVMESLFATASADNNIGIWDLRNLKEKVHTLIGHQDAVTSISWHPHLGGILGSGSYDRRIIFWDLTKIGNEQQPEDVDDGPPELLFMHGGHTNHLADFSWNPHEPWLVCSAAEDNLLQIWKVADSIVGVEEEENELGDLQ